MAPAGKHAKTASVAVIGAGVIGASVAYHLAARGVRDVLALDRASGPGRGSTGAATGGFRAQFETAIHVRLSLLAREKLLCFHEETGVDPGYRPAGYLWIARSEGALEALRAALRVQREAGLTEAVLLDPAGLERVPHVRTEGAAGGAFCPTDGFIRPLAILDGYRRAAGRLGATVEYGVEVTGFRRGDDGRIHAVETSTGPVGVDAVVNAAGPWAGDLAALAGVRVPVTPLRRQILPTAPTDALPEDMPMTIWMDDGFHLRVRDGRALLLWPTPGEPGAPYDTRVDPAWMEDVTRMARERVPPLRDVPVDRPGAWAGLYEMSPDRHALLGAAPGISNFYLANGSSGHGVMHAPALGQLLAEIVTDGAARSLDATALRPGRFDEGGGNPVSGLL